MVKEYNTFDEWYADFKTGTGASIFSFKENSRRQLVKWLGAHPELITADAKNIFRLGEILPYYGFFFGIGLFDGEKTEFFVKSLDKQIGVLAILFASQPKSLSVLETCGLSPFMRGLGRYTQGFAQTLTKHDGAKVFALGLIVDGSRAMERIEAFILATDLELFMKGLDRGSKDFAEGISPYAFHFGSLLGSRAGLFAKGLGPFAGEFMTGLGANASAFISGLARARKVEMRDQEALRVWAKGLGVNTFHFARGIGTLIDKQLFMELYTRPFIEGAGENIEHFARGLEEHAFNFGDGMNYSNGAAVEFGQALGKYASLFAKGLGNKVQRFMDGLGHQRGAFFSRMDPPAIKLFNRSVAIVVEEKNAESLRCAYCHGDLKENEPILTCSRCNSIQHKECGEGHAKCITLGCTGKLVKSAFHSVGKRGVKALQTK